MNAAALCLLALVVSLLFFDWITLKRRGRRMLMLETIAFAVGAFFIVFPDLATRLAHAVGIGRGVDFVLYPLVIWLVRESLVTRHLRWEESRRLTEVVRALAIHTAHHSTDGAPLQSVGSSASRTT